MTEAEHRRLIAEREFHLAMANEISERLDMDVRTKESAGLNVNEFRPEWKSGIRLSKKGEAAIIACYDKHMKQAEVAKLFRISESAANAWHKRWLSLHSIA